MEVSRRGETEEDEHTEKPGKVTELRGRVGNPVKPDQVKNKLRDPPTDKDAFQRRLAHPEYEKGRQAEEQSPRRKGNITCPN